MRITESCGWVSPGNGLVKTAEKRHKRNSSCRNIVSLEEALDFTSSITLCHTGRSPCFLSLLTECGKAGVALFSFCRRKDHHASLVDSLLNFWPFLRSSRSHGVRRTARTLGPSLKCRGEERRLAPSVTVGSLSSTLALEGDSYGRKEPSK